MINTFLTVTGSTIPTDTAELRLAQASHQAPVRLEAMNYDGVWTLVGGTPSIDGLLLNHGFRGVAEPVLAWRIRALPGQARAYVPAGSAAEVIGLYCQQAGAEYIGLQVAPDGDLNRQLPLRICAPIRFVDLDSPTCEIVFNRLLLTIGRHRDRVVPDYPCPAAWIPVISRSPSHQVDGGGPGVDPTAVHYDLNLLGLNAPVRVSYRADDLVVAGDDEEVPLDPFQVLVWPALPDPAWKFFSVVVGQKEDGAWQEATWGIYTTTPPSGTATPSPMLLRPCLTRVRSGLAKAEAERAAPLVGLSGKRVQAISADRPRFLEIQMPRYSAGGTLELLGESGATLRTETYQLGLDMGTSNTCLSIKQGRGGTEQSVDKIDSFNFNMAHPSAFCAEGVGRPGATGLILVRVGDPTRLRTAVPWLPGIEGPVAKSTADGPLPLSQLPSLVIAMPDFFRQWPTASDELVRNALPVQDIAIPPLDFVESFGNNVWVQRSVTSMKWARAGDARPGAFLQKYLAGIFLFVSAKLGNAGALTIKLSYPLTFTPNDRSRLHKAATDAAAEVLEYTGVTVTPSIYTDESRCLAATFSGEYAGPEPSLLVLCDIGGGSIDLAVATHHKTEGNSLVFLTADSLRFGANLLFNATAREVGQVVFAPPQDVPEDMRPAYVREKLRREVRRTGFDALLARGGPAGVTARGRFRLYFRLVNEYLARSVASVIRNPYRFYAAVTRLWQNASNPIDSASCFNPQIFAATPASIGIVLTGNGWRGLEVLSSGFPLDDQHPKVREMETSLALRIQALVRDPENVDEFSPYFTQFRLPRISVSVGLKRTGVDRVVKEALADSVLRYEVPGVNGRAFDTGLACANGVNEESFDFNRLLATGKGEQVQPWYSLVGALAGTPTLEFRNAKFAPVPEPSYTPFPSEIGVPQGPAKPELPADIQNELNQNGISGDIGVLLRAELAAIRSLVNDEGGQRSRPVLSALYVHCLSTLFDPEWRWGAV